ncbi:hypothetical protein EG327_008306 [Venturia inaequalis]|uniref:Bromo domain-containing protein n=1 Tax=Venturia inaequalis TaxID=5025 RepID=A0A8H3UV68_VENIN|nr:hypothetical protein EG327_008306 [Venturia inaequalis]
MSAYTPLEALLLFQYVSNYGLSSGAVFNKVSAVLKNDQQISRSSSYDSRRLNPDALRDFFLRMLRDSKSELDDPLGVSRKRKVPSPTTPNTLDEAVQDIHLLPPLIRKLYARYREHATIEIRESERKYAKLKKELEDIESGAWNDRLQKEFDRGEWDHVIRREKPSDVDMVEPTVDRFVPFATPRPAPELPGPLPNGPTQGHVAHLPELPKEQGGAQALARASNAPERPAELVKTRVPEQPKAQSPSLRPGLNFQPSQQIPPSHSPSIPPKISPRPLSSQFAPPHHVQQAPRPTPLAPSPGPRPQEIQRAQNRTPTSPAMLPPPLPGVSPAPLPPYPFPMSPQQPSRQLSQNPYAAGQASQPHMVPGQQSYAGPHSPYAHIPPYAPPPHGGMQLEPWAVGPQTPTAARPQSFAGHPMAQTPARPPFPTHPGVPPPLGHATPYQQPIRFSPFDIASMLKTPMPNAARRPAVSTPSKAEYGTRWTPMKLPARAMKKRQSPPARPRTRSVSPISEPSKSPPPEAVASKPPSTSRQAATAPGPAPETTARVHRSRRARGGSVASSAIGSSIRGRTRSQSVASHADDVSMIDNDSVTGRAVKNEPSTPADAMDSIHPTIEGLGTPHNSFLGTRRAALQSNTNKRKRGTRDDSEASDMTVQPRLDKGMVVAVRNFHKTSQTIMNDLTSHKHASLFNDPVKDKHAPGYSSIIKRPQNFNTIKKAISAGNRAVSAISAKDPSTALVGSPRDAGGSVVLPMSEELVPPKGIVNSAQLEKEVMRVFVNAVMFNPGDSDLVHDAREMFEGMERTIGDFRSVERSSGLASGSILPQPIRDSSSKPRESTGQASESVPDVEGDLEDTPAAAIARRRR